MPNTNQPRLPTVGNIESYRDSIAGKMGWFWYATPNQAIAIGGPPATPQLVIDGSSDFLALALMGFSDRDQLALPPVDFYTIEIRQSSSDRAYQSNPLHSRLVCGTAELPHYLSTPIFFPHSTAISLTLTALNPAVAYNIRIAFGGVKLYQY